MADEIIIRRAEPADAATVAAFNVAMAQETEGKRLDAGVVTDGVRAVLGDAEHGFYVVAEVGSEVVAALLVTYEWSDWRCGRFWWIQSVYVRPSYRRQGVFRKLHAFVKDEAGQAEGVCGLRLYVEDENRAAQQVYAALGLRRTPYHIYEQPL